MKKFFFSLLSWTLLLSFFPLSAETLYSLSKNSDPLKDFISEDPESVSLSWDAKGGKFGKGALTIHFKKMKKGLVKILGPKIPLVKRGIFITDRQIIFDTYLRIQNCGAHPLQMRFSTWPNRFARVIQPYRFWETLIDPQGYDSRWINGDEIIRNGIIPNLLTNGQVIFLVEAEKAGGKVILERFDVKESYTVNHLIITASRDHHYTAEKALFTVRLYNPEKIISGTIRLVNETGKPWKEIAIKKGEKEVKVSLDQQGYYELIVNAKYADGSKVKTVSSLAVTGPQIPENVRRKSRFGICRVWATNEWAKKIGSNVQYSGWSLKNVKQGPDGKMFFQGKPVSWDKGVRTHAALFGMLPAYLLKKEHQNKNGLYAPANWDQFAEAVYVWAKANPMPDVMNIFNEPNARWYGTRKDFIKIHNVITDSIKKAKPEAKVGGPSFYSIPPIHEFRRYVEGGILRNMDYLVIHAYVNATPPEEEFIEKIIALQDYMQTTPYKHLPLVFTEFGWCTPPGDWQKPVTPLKQAQYLARSLILCTVRNVRDMAYFCGKWPSYQIINSDDTPKPALPAYCVTVQELAAVEKGGKWLKVDPDTHAAFFPRNGKTIAAFWTGNLKKEFILPEKPDYVRAMTGTRLAAERKQKISESPIYAQFSDIRFAAMKELPVQEILPDMTINVPGKILIRSDIMVQKDKNTFLVPAKAKQGVYSFVTEDKAHQITIHRFLLKEPFNIKFSDCSWDGHSPTAKLCFNLSSKIKETNVQAVLKIGKEKIVMKTISFKKGNNTILFELNHPENGKRYTGTLKVKTKGWQALCNWDTTPVVIPYLTKSDRLLWKNVPSIEIHPWSNTGNFKASFKAYASRTGIHFHVVVNDPVMNRLTRWSEMWKTDSIQLALDIDTDTEWEPNRVDGRFNGHRLIQLGYARAQDKDSVQAWVFSSYIPQGIQQGPGFELMKQARVWWNPPCGPYVYDISIPWKLLGINAPKAGTRIGFALLINNADQDQKRKFLPFFDGIAQWEPARFGKILLHQID